MGLPLLTNLYQSFFYVKISDIFKLLYVAAITLTTRLHSTPSYLTFPYSGLLWFQHYLANQSLASRYICQITTIISLI